MVQAVRAGGGSQPVSIGDGAWGREVTGSDNGFRIRDLSPLVDWLGPHNYHMTDDPVRQHFVPAIHAELLARFGRPVVMEEFGLSSDFVSAEGAADYYRQVLHTTLLAGASPRAPRGSTRTTPSGSIERPPSSPVRCPTW